jgi:hypothetical protein
VERNEKDDEKLAQDERKHYPIHRILAPHGRQISGSKLAFR